MLICIQEILMFYIGEMMFGFFKKNKKTVEKADKRKRQRRLNTTPRRTEYRWEPDKSERRDEMDRRKDRKTWNNTNSK